MKLNYSKNDLSKKNSGEYILNLDEYELVETHFIALYMNAENVNIISKLFVLQFKILKKKIERSLEINILEQIFTECKHTIQ